MHSPVLPLPDRKVMVEHVCNALSRYWPHNSPQLVALPVIALELLFIEGPLQLRSVQLPDWAKQWGVEGVMLVPVEASHSNAEWREVDWWLAAFLLLECWHERQYELQHKPIHSYSCRLHGWDSRVWDHAWVNRIALFLRAWVAHVQGTLPDTLFGELPPPEIVMTHDVDAISKTLPIRLKQGLFNLYNASLHLLKGEPAKAGEKIRSAFCFLFHTEDWWTFDRLLELEKQAGIHAHFNFYADFRKKTFQRWLFDPGYDVRDVRIRALIQKIRDCGGKIGLHPSFDSWESSELIRQQTVNLSASSTQPIQTCRQHWLRFSWQATWEAQETAGIVLDTTLMFNDRPGYRAGSALIWRPWSQRLNATAQQITVLPTVMMDSHFYDYQQVTNFERKNSIHNWIKEVKSVNGQIAVLWHSHTIAKGYGWSKGFDDLIHNIRELQ